jgi:hypothetical protein
VAAEPVPPSVSYVETDVPPGMTLAEYKSPASDTRHRVARPVALLPLVGARRRCPPAPRTAIP